MGLKYKKYFLSSLLVLLLIGCAIHSAFIVFDVFLFPVGEDVEFVPRRIQPLLSEASKRTGIKKILVRIVNDKSKSDNVAALRHTYKGPLIEIARYTLDNYSDEEILQIIYHELGHYRHNDGLIIMLLELLPVLLLAALYILFLRALFSKDHVFYNLKDMSLLIFVYLLFVPVAYFITFPVCYGYMRISEMEYAADHFSAKVGDRKIAVQALTKYDVLPTVTEDERSLSYFEYIDTRLGALMVGWGLYTHPPIEDRIHRFSDCAYYTNI